MWETQGRIRRGPCHVGWSRVTLGGLGHGAGLEQHRAEWDVAWSRATQGRVGERVVEGDTGRRWAGKDTRR